MEKRIAAIIYDKRQLNLLKGYVSQRTKEELDEVKARVYVIRTPNKGFLVDEQKIKPLNIEVVHFDVESIQQVEATTLLERMSEKMPEGKGATLIVDHINFPGETLDVFTNAISTAMWFLGTTRPKTIKLESGVDTYLETVRDSVGGIQSTQNHNLINSTLLGILTRGHSGPHYLRLFSRSKGELHVEEKAVSCLSRSLLSSNTVQVNKTKKTTAFISSAPYKKHNVSIEEYAEIINSAEKEAVERGEKFVFLHDDEESSSLLQSVSCIKIHYAGTPEEAVIGVGASKLLGLNTVALPTCKALLGIECKNLSHKIRDLLHDDPEFHEQIYLFNRFFSKFLTQ